MALALLSGLMEIVYSENAQITSDPEHPETAAGMLISLVSLLVLLVLTVGVIFRARYPLALTLVGAVAGIVLPLGPVFALIGLADLIAYRRDKRVVIGGVAVALAVVVVSAITDIYGSDYGASIVQTFLANSDTPDSRVELPFIVPLFVVVISLAVPIGIGILMRMRGSEQEARRSRDEIDVELTRSQERERIAHEIHDVLGHRLSLLSLQAGALRNQANDYPELVESAEAIRANAAQSMDDLRLLLNVIQGESTPVSLGQLSEIIQSSAVGNQQVNLTVYLQDAERAPADLSRAVVRIVQEVITNARKHAPGTALRLSVTGAPGNGISIHAANVVAERGAEQAATGRGLTGMHERVRVLGGDFRAGRVGNEFRVEANLPWVAG